MKKICKKSLAWILSVMMLIGFFVVPCLSVSATQSSSGGFNTGYTLTGDGFTDMVNIAMAQNEKTQAQIGYSESWCADFVSDCARLAGQESAIPFNGVVQSMYNAVIAAGGSVVGSAQAGDLVFFTNGSGYGHVGIALDGSRNISGNIWYNGNPPSKVCILNNSWEGYNSWTYVRPNYKHTPVDTTSPTISDIYHYNFTEDGYTLHFIVHDDTALSYVRVYTQGSVPQTSEDMAVAGTGWEINYRVKYSDHGNVKKGYTNAIWVFDTAGNRGDSDWIYVPYDGEEPNISDVTVSQISSKGYRVTCKVTDDSEIAGVSFPTWTTNNGQDDLIWHKGTISGGYATYYVNTSDHNGEVGDYLTHIYASDIYDNTSSVSAGVWTISDEPIMVSSIIYEGHKYIVYNSGKTWTEAKQWCEQNGGYLATTTTESEWNAVKSALEQFNGVPCWLGAESTSGSWKWLTGEIFDYSNWDVGQPDCYNNNEFYLGTFFLDNYIGNYNWNDFPNSFHNVGGFVFEKEITPTVTDTFNGNTYEYYSDTVNWNEAFRFCEKKGGHLVTINSKEENDFVLGMTNGECSSLWIGGKTNSAREAWRWITGEPFDYQNWSDGEPNNHEGKGQDSVRMYVSGDTAGKWDDKENSNSGSGFVCEYENDIDASKYEPSYKETYNGHEYWFFDKYVSWQTAKKICEAKGGYLAIIDDENENEMVRAALQNTSKGELWLGATDIEEEGVWRDVKGNVLKYTNWYPGMPDNYLNREDYLIMYPEGKWNDASVVISEDAGFVCEFDDHCSAYGHTFTDTVVSPTTTSKGFTLHTCSVCGYSYKDNYTGGKLVNKAVLSARSIHLGETLTISARTEGGIDPITYAYYYKLSTKNSWNKLSDGFVSDTSKAFKPGSEGTYDIKIVAKDSAGTTAQRAYQLTVDNPVLNRSTLSDDTINKGGSVTVKAAASGGTAPYTYSYLYKLSTKSTWNKLSDGFVTDTEKSLVLGKAGIYDVKVIAKDSKEKTDEKTFRLTVEDPLVNNSTISSDTVNKGEVVTVTGKASGGTAPYTYAYYYKLSTKSTWNKLSDGFVSDTAQTLRLNTAGVYDIRVIAKDSDGTAQEKRFSLTVEDPLVNKASVTAEKINKGNAVKLKAAASGGTAPYTYSYLYKLSTKSSWNKLSDGFVTETSQVLKPGKAGIYDLKVIAKDSEGTTAEKTFRLTVEDPVLNRSSVNAEIIAEGGTIVITASATGGTAPYTYSYLYKLSTKGSWNKLSDGYVSDTSKSLKLGKAGEYDIKVIARDSAGAASEKTFTVEVI